MVRGEFLFVIISLHLVSLAVHWVAGGSTSYDAMCHKWDDYKPIPSDTPKRWINPCGVTDTKEDWVVVDWENPTHTDWITMFKVLDGFISRAKESFEDFRRRYSNETFGREWCLHHKDWENHTLNFLPNIPKELGKQIDKGHLESLQTGWFIVRSYLWLQVVDIGLEQVLYDWSLQKETGNPGFHEKFQEIWRTNNGVLCQVWDIGRQRNSTFLEDPDRSVMTPDLRHVTSFAQRSLRDWIIFREYMILMEYMVEVIDYFLAHKEKIWEGIHRFGPG